MKITDDYRKAQRGIAALCAVGIGWSTAQFQLNSLSIDGVVTIDTSNASIPMVISFGILYFMIRCTLDFAMQSVDVRRWNLAQIDYKITLRLVQVSVLLVAAGSLYRSVETIAYVVVGTIVLLVASILPFTISFFVMVPIMLHLRQRQGRYGAVAGVLEAEGWSWLMVGVFYILMFAALGFAAINYEPIATLWPTLPSATAISIFVVLVSVVILSIYAEIFGFKELLFASQPPPTEERRPDGTIGISFSKKTGEE